MEQHTDSQYDDDLTVGIEDVDDDSFDTGYVDLFEFSGEEESPIARLKTIVLSIDWEITDEVLTQFNEELLDLKDIWSDDPIKLVYVQALEKISKYIFQQKSEAHPNAIKLLLTFYHNLEKIVLDESLSEADKKRILRIDVKKFEQLKSQIENVPAQKAAGAAGGPMHLADESESHPLLYNLKAAILGMDWEITERELTALSQELKKLEKEFAGNRVCMLFLQGMAALGGYIKFKKSDAHRDSFKLLFSFYEGFEKIVVGELSHEEQKAVLLPEVEKFEAFKTVITPTLATEVPGRTDAPQPPAEPDEADGVAPAFAELPDDVHGFQAESEAESLGEDAPDVDGRLADFFSDEEEDADAGTAAETGTAEAPPAAPNRFSLEAEDKVDSFFSETDFEDAVDFEPISTEDALRGVDVETEADDESGEEALPTGVDGTLAPALSDMVDDDEYAPSLDTAGLTEEEAADPETADLEERLGQFFPDDEEGEDFAPGQEVDPLAGAEVDYETDEELEEEPLSFDDEDIPPAVPEGKEEEAAFPAAGEEADAGESIEGTLDAFFSDEEPEEAGEAARPEAPAFSLPAEDEDVLFDTVPAEEVGDLPVDALPEAEIEGGSEAESEAEEQFSSFDSDNDEQEFFAALDERVDEPGEFQMELLDETDELTAAPLTEETEEEDTTGDADTGLSAAEAPADRAEEADVPEEPFVFGSDDTLADLRAGIASLGVEISEDIVSGVLEVVNGLGNHHLTRPVDKTFLQLISAIVQHIGQYQYEASAEAHGLLLSVFEKLELVQKPETDAEQAQELLLAETGKVLVWQQRMLDRQAIKKGGRLTFIDPVRSEGSDRKAGDFSAVFEEVDDDETESAGSAESAALESADPVTGLLKKEMDELRAYLHAEIEELKRQLRHDDRG